MAKIVVDSGCCLTPEMRNKSGINIEVIPLKLQLGEHTYIDDINLDIEKYLDAIDVCTGTPKTAAPSPQNFLDAYKGKESVYVLTLSQKLSGSYNSAMLAKEMYLEEYGEKFIHVFDTCSLSVGLTSMAIKINELAKQNMKDDEIARVIDETLKASQIYGLLEKYDTLVKAGRVNPQVAKIASLLSFKVIVYGDEGNISFRDKARGQKKAMTRLIDIMAEQNLNWKERTLWVSHVKCMDKVLEFQEEALKKIPFNAVKVVEASGLCSTYANRDGFIISF